MKRTLLLRCVAEVAGTALLVGIGTASIVLGAKAGGVPQWVLAVAWFAAVTIPVFAFVSISGAHLNPVVTAALATSGRIAWGEVPAYVASQFIGAFVGSALVLLSLGNYANLGATVPQNGEVAAAFVGELAFTALLIGAIFHLADRGEGPGFWRLFLPGLVVGLSTFFIGPISGSSLNPARTIAPAVLSGVYTDIWVYLIAVPIGAIAVALAWKPRAVDILDRGPGRVDDLR
ncbi:MAG: MIP/aquaporin family protein [Thermoplasmata archaeon]